MENHHISSSKSAGIFTAALRLLSLRLHSTTPIPAKDRHFLGYWNFSMSEKSWHQNFPRTLDSLAAQLEMLCSYDFLRATYCVGMCAIWSVENPGICHGEQHRIGNCRRSSALLPEAFPLASLGLPPNACRSFHNRTLAMSCMVFS